MLISIALSRRRESSIPTCRSSGCSPGVGTAIILGYGGSLALRKEITVGELAAFILYLGMFFGPIQTMGDLYNSLLSTAASAERIFGLLDTEPQVQDRAGRGTDGSDPRPRGVRERVV